MLVGVEHVLEDVKHLDLIGAAKDIGSVIWMLPDAVKNCENMDSDIHAIKEWADVFKHPLKLTDTIAKRWLTHEDEIVHMLHKEQEDLAKHQYFSAGDDTAAALVDLLGPIVPKHHA